MIAHHAKKNSELEDWLRQEMEVRNYFLKMIKQKLDLRKWSYQPVVITEILKNFIFKIKAQPISCPHMLIGTYTLEKLLKVRGQW